MWQPGWTRSWTKLIPIWCKKPPRVFIPRVSRFALPPEHCKIQYALLLKQRLPYVFTYKPSDFSVFDKKVWEIFSQETGFCLYPRVWNSKTSTNQVLMRNDRKFHDCSALYVTCFKIDMTITYSDHQSDSLLPTHWKTISLNSAKTLLISHYKWNIWSLCRKKHSIACSSSSGHLGVKRLIFARLVDISSLPERIVAWSRLQRRTMDSLSPTQRIAL